MGPLGQLAKRVRRGASSADRRARGRSEREGDAGCGIAGAERRWRVGPAVRAGDARGGRAAPTGGPGLSASRGGEGERGRGLWRDGPVLARERAECRRGGAGLLALAGLGCWRGRGKQAGPRGEGEGGSELGRFGLVWVLGCLG